MDKEKFNKIKDSKFFKDKRKLSKIKADLKRKNLEKNLGKLPRLSRGYIYLFFSVGFLIVFFQKQFYVYKGEEKEKSKPYIIPIKVGRDNNLSHLSHAKLPDDLIANKAGFIEVIGQQPELQKSLQLQKTTLKRLNLPLEVTNELAMTFRFIPRGSFMMGSPKNEEKRGETELLHLASVPNHMYISKFEVTQEIWQKVMGTNSSFFKKSPQHPVEEVTYQDTVRFVNKLNKMLGVEPRTYRVLSENEWEYACRAGSSKAFYFGDDAFKLPLFGEYNDSNGASTKAVGGRLPNAWGLYDMHGNVAEWTRSPFWFYTVDENIYAYTWDTPIYDGDVPIDRDKPIDNFKLNNFTVGSQDNLFYSDDNINNQYEANELIWADREGGIIARFDYGIDTVIYSLYDDFKRFDNQEGTQKNLYYADSNNNKGWDNGEKIWSYSSLNRQTQKIVIRGGGYNDYSRICRSASRLAIYPKSHSNVWGFRIVRYLKDFDLPFSDSYRKDK